MQARVRRLHHHSPRVYMKKRCVILLVLFRSLMISAESQNVPSNSMYLSGRSYYDFLIDRASKRNWALPITVYYTFEDSAFDCDGNSASLASVIFNTKCPITFEDIYLFSKLSNDNLINLLNCTPPRATRGIGT